MIPIAIATQPAGRTRPMPKAALVISAAAPTVTKSSPVPKATTMLSADRVLVTKARTHTRRRSMPR